MHHHARPHLPLVMFRHSWGWTKLTSPAEGTGESNNQDMSRWWGAVCTGTGQAQAGGQLSEQVARKAQERLKPLYRELRAQGPPGQRGRGGGSGPHPTSSFAAGNLGPKTIRRISGQARVRRRFYLKRKAEQGSICGHSQGTEPAAPGPGASPGRPVPSQVSAVTRAWLVSPELSSVLST